jgi:two-component system phosphate regulon sensor histidine kinase PhoR
LPRFAWQIFGDGFTMRRRLRHLFPVYYAGFLLGLVAIGVAMNIVLENQLRTVLERELVAVSRLLSDSLAPAMHLVDTAAMQQQCEQFAAHTSHRAVVIDRHGRVLADSHYPPAGQSHAVDNPQIRAALANRVLQADANRVWLDRKAIAVALPVARAGETLGVLRTLHSAGGQESLLHPGRLPMLAAAVAVALMAMVLLGAISWRMRRPLATMRQGAGHFARGDLAYQFDAAALGEMSELAGALNEMARKLDQRIDTMTRQGSEQAAVLASMVEGVLAVDIRKRVISINAAAAQLMGTKPENAKGRGLQEVIRNADLLRFVSRTLDCDEPVEDDVVLRSDDERVLQARGTSLRNAAGRPIGAVVVLHDVTRMRKLETLRRDFVANVSHELKTPITSIKGFVETLLDGALADAAEAERFLRIVARQADRLDAIIEDLLSLAKIEQSVEAANVELISTPLAGVLHSAMNECASKAEQRQIGMRLECQTEIQANINAPLLEQAVINLLDNAIKYSEPGSEIRIVATPTPEAISIQVHDRGCGIEAEHLDRLFERFYRVDKARSRKFGGTGLGLSIVKHIAHAHGGHVSVSSTPGKGSTFSIHLPLPAASKESALQGLATTKQ